jgi:hypothetical protein
MKGISSHTIKLDQEITYTDARKIKDFTKNFKENDRLKIDRGIKTFDKNGVLESNFSATFTKTNNTKLTNLIHKFEKLKNAIFINKSFFHKANSIENIFNHSSISVKKLNNLASEITVPEDNEDMEKSFAEHNKIANLSDSIITGQKFSQEENTEMTKNYEKYKEENKNQPTMQYFTKENRKNMEATKMWQIINDDIGL